MKSKNDAFTCFENDFDYHLGHHKLTFDMQRVQLHSRKQYTLPPENTLHMGYAM